MTATSGANSLSAASSKEKNGIAEVAEVRGEKSGMSVTGSSSRSLQQTPGKAIPVALLEGHQGRARLVMQVWTSRW